MDYDGWSVVSFTNHHFYSSRTIDQNILSHPKLFQKYEMDHDEILGT